MIFINLLGQWSIYLRDDSKDPHAAEASDSKDGGSCWERAADPGERETVPGAEAHPGTPAWPRGGWATHNLPTDAEGENKADEGESKGKTSSS